jgi:hypothetical protein
MKDTLEKKRSKNVSESEATRANPLLTHLHHRVTNLKNTKISYSLVIPASNRMWALRWTWGCPRHLSVPRGPSQGSWPNLKLREWNFFWKKNAPDCEWGWGHTSLKSPMQPHATPTHSLKNVKFWLNRLIPTLNCVWALRWTLECIRHLSVLLRSKPGHLT